MSNGDNAPEMPLAAALKGQKVKTVEEAKPRRGVGRPRITEAGMYPEEWMPKFLDHLRVCPIIEKAAALTPVTSKTVGRYLESDPEFRAEKEAAMKEGYAVLEQIALERAVNGHYEEELSRDGIPTKVLRIDNKLLTFLLERLKREKYGRNPEVLVQNNVSLNFNWSV